MATNDNNINENEFLKLLACHQQSLRAFVLALISNSNDAEDVYQETLVEMWKKYKTFEPGTNFIGWAITIAKYKALAHRRKMNNSKIQYDESAYKSIESDTIDKESTFQDHLGVLERCTQELPTKDQALLELRYEKAYSYKDISRKLDKSVPAVYRAMAAIHTRLSLNVRHALRLEELF